MKAFVVVATKGRAKETFILLDYLAKQTLAPTQILVVGSEQADVAGLADHPLMAYEQNSIELSRAGLTIQRNAGLEALKYSVADLNPANWFVAFFDDDFRPAPDWLEQVAIAMNNDPRVVGVTGNVLADGVGTEFGLSEEESVAYLSGKRPAESHWSSSTRIEVLDGLYGCNMAYRGSVAKTSRFDENLPMYGWQEDWDYSSRARSAGTVILQPACRGVHLGSSNGRTSGVRFGYSQISNPIFLLRKGTMSPRKAFTLMFKNVTANSVKSLLRIKMKDFPGRLRGNFMAVWDLLRGKLHPLQATKI